MCRFSTRSTTGPEHSVRKMFLDVASDMGAAVMSSLEDRDGAISYQLSINQKPGTRVKPVREDNDVGGEVEDISSVPD